MITPGPPIQRPELNKKTVDDSQIPVLLEFFANLRQKQITREVVIFDWMKRSIQPFQARETFGFQYQGTSDPSQYLEKEISNGEILS